MYQGNDFGLGTLKYISVLFYTRLFIFLNKIDGGSE